MISRACFRFRNQFVFKHSSLNLPLKLSAKAFSIGLPGRMKFSFTPLRYAHSSRARPTNSGSVPTDKQFTGQRLDDTGLYYYGARYYDPIIGRFISADTIVPDFANPQSLNRYSYCINNPLKYVDPSGQDYVIVGGSGSKQSDFNVWFWNMYLKAMGSDEIIVYLPDNDPELFPFEWYDVNPRVEQLSERLEIGDLTDIKLIGHSEGAATVGKYLSNLSYNKEYASQYVQDELRSAILLECPTGASDTFVYNFNAEVDLYYLPARMANTDVDIKLSDQWNVGSIAHASGILPGWEGNSISHDSRKIEQNKNLGGFIIRLINFIEYHNIIWYMYTPID